MSLNGVLEDVPLADVLQFIHLGRRTGTLYMWQDEERRAEIGFYDGRIVSAWTPTQRRLGDRLLGDEVIDRATLESALEHQTSPEGAGQTLGRILLERFEVPREAIHRVIREQMQETIFELITWRRGHFNFEIDELNPTDDFSLAPGELLDDLDLNTQMLLLDAARIFDERHRSDSAVIDLGPESEVLEERLRRAGLGYGPLEAEAETEEGALEAEERETATSEALSKPEVVRCQVVSEDRDLASALKEALGSEKAGPEQARVVAVRLREAGNRVPGETFPPIVVLDLRDGDLGPDDLAFVGRTRPNAPLVVVAAGVDQRRAAYSSGAVAVVDGEVEQLAGCCRNLIRTVRRPSGQGAAEDGGARGFGRFRRVVFDIQTGLMSATMALNLMHVISESVERAVLFLVQGDQFVGVGAFGFAADGRPLAELTRNLRLDPAPHCAFRRAVEEARPQPVGFEEAEMPEEFVELVGAPETGRVVIFPVMGTQRAISVIYTDNGPEDREIEDIRILELATAQVGVAFENEILRHQLRGRGLEGFFE